MPGVALAPAGRPLGQSAAMSPGPVVSTTGFVGIHSMDLPTANVSEHEPPDQGLAVHDNVAVEITNRVLRLFDAATGAPLIPPVSQRGPEPARRSLFLVAAEPIFDPWEKRGNHEKAELPAAGRENIDDARDR